MEEIMLAGVIILMFWIGRFLMEKVDRFLEDNDSESDGKKDLKRVETCMEMSYSSKRKKIEKKR